MSVLIFVIQYIEIPTLQDTRFFISGKLPIVHDYAIFNKMLVTYFLD